MTGIVPLVGPFASGLALDLMGPFKAGIRGIVEWLLGSTVGVIETLLSLYVGLLGKFVRLDPSRLGDLQALWSLGLAVYVLGLGVVALGFLATMQLFPSEVRMDPYRVAERAFVATIVLVLVNPPGPATDPFGRGVFGWAFGFTNAVQNLYLADATTVSIVVDVGAVGDTVGTAIATLVATGIMAVLLAISILPAVLVVGLRKVVLFGLYGLSPVIGLLWIVDVGPLQYGNRLATMALQATVTLLLLGVLVSATLAASSAIIGAEDGTGGSTATGVEEPTVDVVGYDTETAVARGVFAGEDSWFRETVTTVIDVVGAASLVSVVGVLVGMSVFKSATGG